MVGGGGAGDFSVAQANVVKAFNDVSESSDSGFGTFEGDAGQCSDVDADRFAGMGSNLYDDLCGELHIKDSDDGAVPPLLQEQIRYDSEIAHANALLTPPPEPPKCMNRVLDLLGGNLSATVCNPIMQSKKVLKVRKADLAKANKAGKAKSKGKHKKQICVRRATFRKVHS